MSKKTVIWIVLSLMINAGFAQQQQIDVRASDKPLSEVLVQLRDSYGLQFSYSENEMSGYKVSLSKTFQSPGEAVEYLLRDFPLSLKMLGNVFIIIPDKKEIKQTKSNKLTGKVVDALSYEPLPFSHIIINNYPTVSDVNGQFAYTASNDGSLHVQISHIGYFSYDSVHQSQKNFRFHLKPSIKEIPEITVKNENPEIQLEYISTLNTSDIKLNNYVASYLPGQGDNAVFNALRLMPGIQVAGEQASDLLMWGSQEGQSRILFDGYTVFGLKNYNDNISVVNPFLVKDIEIKKGGFDARYGNRVGGLVNITGINGNQKKPAFSFNISNTTLNSILEVPVFKNSSMVVAYRQTFYNLYNSDDFNVFSPVRSVNNPNSNAPRRFNDLDMSVLPESYTFRDFNLKYTHNFSDGNLASVSFYRGGDDFNLLADASVTRNFEGKGKNYTTFNIELENEEHNRQTGISAFYSHQWKGGDISKISVSGSGFTRETTKKIFFDNLEGNIVAKLDSSGLSNNAREAMVELSHRIFLKKGHNIELGSGLITNNADVSNYTAYKNLEDRLGHEIPFTSNRAELYISDYLPLSDLWVLNAGVRFYFSRQTSRNVFADPRVSLNFKPSPRVTLSASWGIYHQFMYKLASVDLDNNYSWYWVTANKNLPVINSRHRIVSANYHHGGFTAKVDAYFKTTRNIIRRTFALSETPNSSKLTVSNQFGDMRSAGADFYLKQKFGKHQAWVSYSLSRITERLSDKQSDLPSYSLSPFHQLHEFKVAALFNIRNFHLSGNYVYGSGLKLLEEMLNTTDVSYHRVDAAVTYRLARPRFMLETGFSILNVFNTENIRYQNLINVNLSRNLGSVKIYSGAVPFTPTLFLKIKI
ncbi:MAG: TonB-dependent receptor [Prolixibacteraceae bacterium]|nr:TonB-dependent receptor [Prolixibacteraceae bacterium]